MKVKSRLLLFILLIMLFTNINEINCKDEVTHNKTETKRLTASKIYREISLRNNVPRTVNSNLVRATAIYRVVNQAYTAKKEGALSINNITTLCLNAYPIPANDNITLKILSNSDTYAKIDIYSEKGHLIFGKSIRLQKGENLIDYDLGSIIAGVYYFVVDNGVKMEKTKFIVVK
ncbi:MAG: T9SS type A sorting domain-containing protein [bacterium]